MTDVLVERGDQRVVHKVVKNKGARFSLAGFGKLTTRARYDRKLTLALGERSDLPRQYFLKLLEAASSKVRAKLEASNPQLVAAIRDTVDDVATAMQHEVRKGSRAHAVAVRMVGRDSPPAPFSNRSMMRRFCMSGVSRQSGTCATSAHVTVSRFPSGASADVSSR